jgi:t-SNARE complex subunit (syntaxin)
MFKIIGLVVVVLVIGAAVYYFGFYKKGKINDRDGDFIPDEVEDAVEDVKDVAKEVKRRAKNVKNELKDVVEAAKELGNQVGDVGSAVKGKKRQGRKKRK